MMDNQVEPTSSPAHLKTNGRWAQKADEFARRTGGRYDSKLQLPVRRAARKQETLPQFLLSIRGKGDALLLSDQDPAR